MSAVPRLSEHLDDFGLVVALRSFYLNPSILKTLIFELIQMVTWLAISRGVKQLVDFSFNWNHCRRKTSRGAWGLSCCWNDVLCSCLGCLGERGGHNHGVIIHTFLIAWDLKHCQRHNGPEGWVHITQSCTNLDKISISESWLSINFKFSTKHQYLD